MDKKFVIFSIPYVLVFTKNNRTGEPKNIK